MIFTQKIYVECVKYPIISFKEIIVELFFANIFFYTLTPNKIRIKRVIS